MRFRDLLKKTGVFTGRLKSYTIAQKKRWQLGHCLDPNWGLISYAPRRPAFEREELRCSTRKEECRKVGREGAGSEIVGIIITFNWHSGNGSPRSVLSANVLMYFLVWLTKLAKYFANSSDYLQNTCMHCSVLKILFHYRMPSKVCCIANL